MSKSSEQKSDGDGIVEGLQQAAAHARGEEVPGLIVHTAAELAERAAIATRVPPTGLAAVMDRLTAVDEDAMVIWTTKGPKGSHVVSISEVLASGEDGVKRSMLVKVYASGKAKVFIDTDLAKLVYAAD